MANTINITIKNCGCGCGEGTRSDVPRTGDPPPQFDYTNPNLPSVDPTTREEPPEGYTVSTLENRQCRAAVWLYNYLYQTANFLGTTEAGKLLLSTTSALMLSGVIRTVGGRVLVAIVTPIIEALVTFGLDPTDVLGMVVTGVVSFLLAEALSRVTITEYLKAPQFEQLAQALQDNQDKIICQFSQAANSDEVREKFHFILQELYVDLDTSETIKAFLLEQLITILWYSPEGWWPGFDDNFLAQITTTCCAEGVDGDPVVAGSPVACSAATFIVDELINLFLATGEAAHWRAADFNPFDNLKEDYYEFLTENLTGHRKLMTLTDWRGYLVQLSEHMYLNRGYFFQMVDSQLLWEYYDPTLFFNTDDVLSVRMQARRAEAIAALFTAADKDEAYIDLFAIFEEEIDAIDTDTQIKTVIKSAIRALINPQQGRLLNLLFEQDSDLMAYPGDCETVPEYPEPPPGATTWYPTGACTSDPALSNVAEGDGEPDGTYAGPWSVGWHQVEFTPVQISEQLATGGQYSITQVAVWWKSVGGNYGSLYIYAKIDDQWIGVHSSGYQGSATGRWEPRNIASQHAGKILSGLRFGFSTSTPNYAHKFIVDGYRIDNFIYPVGV